GREGREAVPSCSGEANARFRRGAVGARSPDGSIERYGCGHRVVDRAVFLNVAVKQGKPRVALVGVHHELVIYATHARWAVFPLAVHSYLGATEFEVQHWRNAFDPLEHACGDGGE